jgi:type VI secretion system VasD/TssJ family lipoprotein
MQLIRDTNGASRHTFTLATRIVGMALAASLLSGCGVLEKVGILSGPEAPAIAAPPAPIPLSQQPYELTLRLTASNDLNPDTQSRPSPVQVRVFLMAPQADLDNKEFAEIFDFDGQVMEPRPLAKVTLRPGQTKDIVLPANKTQSMLMVAAAYRDPYQAVWKAIATVTPSDSAAALATIGANSVSINLSR